MPRWWVLCVVLGSSWVLRSLSQSGNGDIDVGSGDPFKSLRSNHTEELEKEPERAVRYESDISSCSVNFHTAQSRLWGSSRQEVKAWEEELKYLKEILHGNQVSMDSLIHTISTEVGELRYQEVIEESITGIKEENLNCDRVVNKVMEEFKTQLEGEEPSSAEGALKVKEEYLSIEGMLHTAETIAQKLESASQALYSSLKRQLGKSHSFH
ncbi:uncharacterized protein LOC136753983 [Amia ocellicauda]|uniref:uncharacterized protein LOC136753983 n=1 Tax=Amia ocellicauda TaxID=2972642 RepID=UPI003463F4DB